MPNNTKKTFETILTKTKIYLVIIAIVLVILCVQNINFIIPSVVVYGLLLVYTFWTDNKNKNELDKHIQELTFNVDTIAKNTLINSPFPLVIIEADGNITWKSVSYMSEFGNTDINNTLSEIVKTLKIDSDSDENKREIPVYKQITIGKKDYKLIIETIKNKSRNRRKRFDNMFAIYIIDNTEVIKALKKFEEVKTCTGIIMIDSYDELIQSMTQEERTQVLTEIETKIYDWVAKFEGIALKTERDRFVIIFEAKYLDKIIENKFEILGMAKNTETEAVIPTTLSIAIVADGNSNHEKYKATIAAMDLVLGRGGDQAVIKRNGKYEFFGGKTQEVEKRTKVKARAVAAALEELIEESEKVLIMGHANGDIDSMGSSLGVYRIVKSLGKTAKIVNNTYGLTLKDFIEAVEQEKEYEGVIIDKQQALAEVTPNTLLVVVDTHKKSYVEVPELLTRTNKIVVIDHHRRGPDYIENSTLMFHEVYASSAAELVTELLQYTKNEATPTVFEAESLYAGIMVDTKNFTFKTGVRTFEAAAYLRKNNIDIIKVKKWFQSDLESYNVISDIVKNTEIIRETIGIAEYSKQDDNANLICAKAADELLTISDITASFVLGKVKNTVYISGRSIGDINVQLILEKLGGGGHSTVAGAQIENVEIEEARERLKKAINEYFEQNAIE